MVRTILKYLYLVLGTGLAVLSTVASYSQAAERADDDQERSAGTIANRERRQRERGGGPVSPMEATEYRADEMVTRPLRTIALVVGYEVVFVGWAICLVFRDELTSTLGPNLSLVVTILAIPRTTVVPEWVVPFLLPTSVVVGLVFAVVVHQSLKTFGDIRYGTSDY